MAQNFGSNFLRGFQPTFARSFDTSYRYGLEQQEEERKRKEELKAQQEQQGILSQLMQGTKQSFNYGGKYSPLIEQEVPLSKEEQFLNYAKLNPQNQNAYEWWQKQSAPRQDEYLAPNLGKFPTIHQWNKTKRILEDTGQPDPLYEEPLIKGSRFVPAETIEGLERWKGYDIEQEIWRDKDGNIVKEGTYGDPKKPTFKNVGDKKVYDLSSYKQKIATYGKREADLSAKITKYKSERINDIDAYNAGLEKIGTYGNAINKAYDKEEIAFYNDMLPEARKYVNKSFYQPLKESGAPENVAYTDREGIYSDYVADLTDDYKNGKIEVDLSNYEIPKGVSEKEFAEAIEDEIFRSALLWGKLKFRRL